MDPRQPCLARKADLFGRGRRRRGGRRIAGRDEARAEGAHRDQLALVEGVAGGEGQEDADAAVGDGVSVEDGVALEGVRGGEGEADGEVVLEGEAGVGGGAEQALLPRAVRSK